ncbi:MAG TPA: 7-carboxy-7-deazaguanine synthase QueE [Chitinophagaceae bacterium]|nr:7-carboxy-7-deazaguanine synthase QueE [Chitinophagaceae bacterium]HNF30528.1 7-carboxy-7-deazaguanine synthase QueE [Chitinophagaceae bacterium]HNJ58459.1 7-carboxy-7-deazaguanine synthase QueE [Chitinophagaceae bacterium]HNL83524.1 7-carboxy-7-deazaguanine synthase QueE [Chitinophagaceae bacterium]HNM34078.1 7-carboxy-7-deazaguanine synthase QueE [Chitinophagaceae bacterium]
MRKTSMLYPVMESFYTLQGEGFYTGAAAYFIRLAGCDVGCVWCDVKESWNANEHPKYSVNDIIEKVLIEVNYHSISNKTNLPIIVITGGEPLMHNLNELTKALQQNGFKTNIETSGSSALSGSWDWICLSPKKFKPPIKENIVLANELKIIVYNKQDFKWAESYAKQVNSHCKLYLQPEWSKRELITPLIVEYIKLNPQWQLSLQTHKYINVP